MIRPTTSLRSAASKARTRNSYTAPKPAPPPPAPTPLSNRLPSHPTPFRRPEPPLVAAAKAKTVKQRNVWESYLVLDPKTRLYFSLGLMAFAAIGLYMGDKLVPESEEEKVARGEKV